MVSRPKGINESAGAGASAVATLLSPINVSVVPNSLVKSQRITHTNVADESKDNDDVSVMSYKDLQKECKLKGLKASGKTAVLIQRLLDSSVNSKGVTNANVAGKSKKNQDDDTDDASTMSYQQLRQTCKDR